MSPLYACGRAASLTQTRRARNRESLARHDTYGVRFWSATSTPASA